MTKTRQWTIFTAIAVLVVFVAGWMLLIKPQKSKAADLRSQASGEQAQVATLQQQISQLESEQRNLPQEQHALQHFATQVPDGPNEPTILRQLYAAANGSDVDLISVTPGPPTVVGAATTGTTTLSAGSAPVAASGLTQLPLTLGIAGTYPNVEMFFQSLEKLPRALMVTGWSLCPVATDSTSASSSGGCSAPSIPEPAGQTPKTGTLGATLNAVVYFTGTAPTTTSGGTTTPSTGASAAPSTAPSTASSTAPSPAASAGSK